MALQLMPVDEAIWVIEHPFEIMKVRMGTRTTVIRLSTGGLWLLAPGAGLETLKSELEALGPVEALVAPNTMHHLFLPDAARLFPEARVYGPAGLRKKQPRLALEKLLPEAPALWAHDIQQQRLEGLGMLQETAFFHPHSQSLILTDLVFNLQHSDHPWSRLFLKLNDAYGKLGPSRMLRSLVLQDREALKHSLEQILNWNFERIIVAHGELVSSQGRQKLREAFQRVGILNA